MNETVFEPRPTVPPPGQAAPTILVVFGATGDLARRKLFPALYNLARDGLLPPDFRLVGCSRTVLSDDCFRELVADAVAAHSRREPDSGLLTELLAQFHFLAGAADDERFQAVLDSRLGELERTAGGGGDRLFYLSIAPELFSPVVERLGERVRAPGAGSTRILIEKPFGRSAAEARAFNRTVLANFAEAQVYRVDHYLGKEEVQNILALRLGNTMFEPFWNSRAIASVQITAAEAIGVGSRAGYYDGVGALRDHLQNHLLQLVCMVAMEPPADFSAAAVRDQKVAVLEAVRSPRPEDVVWGQYGPGEVGGEAVPGYHEEQGVAPGSRTETFTALRLSIETPRWAGVPFYIRTGKRLAAKKTEIAIALRPSLYPAFVDAQGSEPVANRVLIGLQPRGGIELTLATKRPGAGMQLTPATSVVASPDPGGEAYERLLLDATRGDATLFARSDEIEGQWRICDPVVGYLAEQAGSLSSYPAGSQGPEEAKAILAEGDAWRTI